MLKPIIELINENVEATLRGISAAAGYTFTPAAVEWEAETNIPLDGKVIIARGDEEPRDKPALGHDEWDVPYAVAVFAARAGAQPTFETKLTRMAADIIRAMQADHNRGGYAINTSNDAPIRDDHGPAFRVAIIKFEIHVRTLKNDPYRQ
jgi:hypothetical protein